MRGPLFAVGLVMLLVGQGLVIADDPKPNQIARSKSEARIREALKQTTQIDFLETPLQDVIETLSAKHKIPIVLNRRALDDEGVATDSPISLRLKDIKLKSAFPLMLDALGLTVIIKNEVLLVTTKTEAETDLTTKMYAVPDLLSNPNEKNPALLITHEKLISVIQETVAPQTWDPVGGPGSVHVLGGVLIVSQTFTVHDQVEKFLSDFRQAYKPGGKFIQ